MSVAECLKTEYPGAESTHELRDVTVSGNAGEAPARTARMALASTRRASDSRPTLVLPLGAINLR